ncbi:MAG: hypothetical protein PHF84_06830 [bacterium]|nr:hypothetical protein [bacterium]
MNRLKKNIINLVFFFFCLLIGHTDNLYSQNIPSDKKYKKMHSEHFTLIYYTSSLKAMRILETAENVHRALINKFYIHGSLHTYLILADTRDQANGMATILPANVIILYDTVPDTLSQPSLLNYYNNMEELLIHEYTHILFMGQTYFPLKNLGFPYVAFNVLLPLSSLEGIAVYMESAYTPMGRVKSSYKEMMFRTAVYEDNVPALDEISVFANKIPCGHGPYIWGGGFHQYLADKVYEENVLRAYRAHANCSCFSFNMKPGTCLSSCFTLFPLNSWMDYYTGLSYYDLYNDWVRQLKDKYTKEIRGIADPTKPRIILPEGEYWQIYDMAVYRDMVYFSAYSPHTGYGLYAYHLSDHRLKLVLSDSFITSLAVFQDKIYFTVAEYHDNVYLFYNLGYYDLRKFEVGKLEKYSRVLSVRNVNKKLLIVQNTEKAKVVKYIAPDNGGQEIVMELDRYDQVSDFIAVSSNELYFIMKKENDYFDIYQFNTAKKALTRLTRNPSTELNLTLSGRQLYFISDFNSVYNLYEYNPDKKQFFRLTDLISGTLRFTRAGNSLYMSLYRSRGYSLVSLSGDRLKHIPVHYTSLTNFKNFQLPSSPIPSDSTKISREKQFHPLLDMLTHFCILPAAETLGPDGPSSIGAIVLFSDVFSRNQLTLQADFYLAPVNKPNIRGQYTYSGNKYQYTLMLARFHTGYEDQVDRDDSIWFSFGYLKNRLFRYLELVTSLNYYRRFHTHNNGNTYYHSFSQGFYYNNTRQYSYSIMPEKGIIFYPRYIMMKKFFKSSYDLDLLHLDLTFHQRMLFRHQVLKLQLKSGLMLNSSSSRPYSISGSMFGQYAPAIYDIELDGYTEYESDYRNYLITHASYNIPLVWIERGIKNMPVFLRNIWFNCYFTAGNGFDSFGKMRWLRGVGNELHFSFYFYYQAGSDITAGYLYELDRDHQWHYYIRTDYSF